MSKKKKETLHLPVIRIVYCTTSQQQETGCQLIQNRIDSNHNTTTVSNVSNDHTSNTYVWGFDCEWKVNYIAGQGTNKVALIQFGTQDLIILFHISQSGIHNTLANIIKSPKYVKIGVNILGDIQKLERDFPSLFPYGSISGVCDIRRLSEVTAVPPQRSLAGQ